MNRMKKSFSELFGSILFGFKTSFCASKFYFIVKICILAISSLISFANISLWKEILDGIVAKNTQSVFVFLAVYLGLRLFDSLLGYFNGYVNTRCNDELTFYMQSILMEKTSRIDLAFFDSAEMADRLSYVRNNFYTVSDMTWLVFDILSAFVNASVTFVIVTTYQRWLGAITLALLVPHFIYNKKYNDKRLKMEKEQLRDTRKRDWYYGAFFDMDMQFEMKLNNIGPLFVKRYNEIWQRLYRVNKREDIRHNLLSLFIMLINVSSEALVIVISTFDIIKNVIGIGELQYNMSMVARLRNQTQELIGNVNRFISNNACLIAMRDFMALKPETEKCGEKIPSDNPKIEFCNVTFRYPNSKEYVLRNCSFSIESHEKIGLIGLNGAGKSTIIKLLFRFYDPEDGCIKLDGRDMREYDVYALRNIFGVLFQDYVTYCLPLREIIALSDFDSRFDDEKLREACDISGVSEIIKDWKCGFDSVLGRYYADNGKDLSGGQWQLVGLARAYFKHGKFMILDEPSAALDPIAEDRIFEQLYRLSKGKGSLTISHRLSNTALADKILVLSDGHIIEQGSHSELMKQNGRYAHLFRLQADKYT